MHPEFIEIQLFKPAYHKEEGFFVNGPEGSNKISSVIKPAVRPNATIMVFDDSHSFSTDFHLKPGSELILTHNNTLETLDFVANLINEIVRIDGYIQYPEELKILFRHIVEGDSSVHVNGIDVLNSTAKGIILQYVKNHII